MILFWIVGGSKDVLESTWFRNVTWGKYSRLNQYNHTITARFNLYLPHSLTYPVVSAPSWSGKSRTRPSWWPPTRPSSTYWPTKSTRPIWSSATESGSTARWRQRKPTAISVFRPWQRYYFVRGAASTASTTVVVTEPPEENVSKRERRLACSSWTTLPSLYIVFAIFT